MDKERYNQLLLNMNNVLSDLNNSIIYIDELKKNINNSIKLWDKIYGKEDVESLYDNIFKQKEMVSNVIIPIIRNKINEINS